MLAHLDNVSNLGIVQESLHVQNEHRRKSLDEHLLLSVEKRVWPCGNGDLDLLRVRYMQKGVAERLYVLGLDVEL